MTHAARLSPTSALKLVSPSIATIADVAALLFDLPRPQRDLGLEVARMLGLNEHRGQHRPDGGEEHKLFIADLAFHRDDDRA